MLTAEDSFSRYCCAYPIPNKEAHMYCSQGIDASAFQCVQIVRSATLRQQKGVCEQPVEGTALRVQD